MTEVLDHSITCNVKRDTLYHDRGAGPLHNVQCKCEYTQQKLACVFLCKQFCAHIVSIRKYRSTLGCAVEHRWRKREEQNTELVIISAVIVVVFVVVVVVVVVVDDDDDDDDVMTTTVTTTPTMMVVVVVVITMMTMMLLLLFSRVDLLRQVTCCHTETETVCQLLQITTTQNTDNGPASPGTDP